MGSDPSPRSVHYTFEPVAEGVHFGRARADGSALANTGLVDLGGETLVFDTSLTLGSAREIRDAAVALTRRPPTVAANSHWHLDHLLGNQVLRAVPIFATRRTIELVTEQRADLEKELLPETLESEIRDLEAQRAAAPSDAARAVYDGALRINRSLRAESHEIRLTPPTDGFEEELRLPGDREATLLSFGAGHTESDAVLFLPESRLLFAGDLVVSGTHPNLRSGDPVHWLTVLDRLEALNPERIAPGHGPMGTASALDTMRDYLSTILSLATQGGDPEIPARFRSFTEPQQFAGNLAYARTRHRPDREAE